MIDFFKTLFGDTVNPRTTEYSARTLDRLDIDSLSDLFPFEYFDETHKVFINKSSFGFCFQLPLVEGGSLDTQRQINSIFRDILEPKLKPSVQFLLVGTNKIADELEAWKSEMLQGEDESDLAKIRKKICTSLCAHLERIALLNNAFAPARTCRLLVSYAQPRNSKREVSDLMLKQLSNLRERITSAFVASGITSKLDIGPQELLDTMRELFAYHHDTKEKLREYEPNQKISHQIFDERRRTNILDNCIEQGENAIQTFSVTKRPTHWFMSKMADLLGRVDNPTSDDKLQIGTCFFVHYGLKMEDYSRYPFEMTAESSKKLASGQLATDQIREEAEDFDGFLKDLNKGERALEWHMSFGLIGKKDLVEQKSNDLIALAKRCEWELTPNKFLHLPVFLSIVPFIWSEKLFKHLKIQGLLKYTSSSEVGKIVPLQGEWNGVGRGVPMLGRRGQVARFTPFNSTGDSFNMAIAAATGGGKSVLMQLLLFDALPRGRVFVIDKGESFKKLCKISGGAYIDIRPDEGGLCLNPFSNIHKDNKKDAKNSLNLIQGIVESILSPENRKLEKDEKTFITQSVKAAWGDKGRGASFLDVAEHLGALDKKQGVILKGFVLSHEALFVGRANIDFASQLVVIETSSVQNDNTGIAAPIIQMMLMQIFNKAILDGERSPSTVFVDEAWSMFSSAHTSKFLEEMARTTRKYNCALIMASQKFSDFPTGVLQNCEWKTVLRGGKASVEHLFASNLTEIDGSQKNFLLERADSLQLKRGSYSELLLLHKKQHSILRLTLDPFMDALVSSSGDDFAYVEALNKQGMSMFEAVCELADAKLAKRRANGSVYWEQEEAA